ANDPELLNWVQGTAAYGILQAYHSYVRPLSDLERDRYYAEATLPASLYGASAPTSEVVLEMRFETIANQLERSEILFAFLAIMRSAPVLPTAVASAAVVDRGRDRSNASLVAEDCGRNRSGLNGFGGWAGAANRSVRGSQCSSKQSSRAGLSTHGAFGQLF